MSDDPYGRRRSAVARRSRGSEDQHRRWAMLEQRPSADETKAPAAARPRHRWEDPVDVDPDELPDRKSTPSAPRKLAQLALDSPWVPWRIVRSQRAPGRYGDLARIDLDAVAVRGVIFTGPERNLDHAWFWGTHYLHTQLVEEVKFMLDYPAGLIDPPEAYPALAGAPTSAYEAARTLARHVGRVSLLSVDHDPTDATMQPATCPVPPTPRATAEHLMSYHGWTLATCRQVGGDHLAGEHLARHMISRADGTLWGGTHVHDRSLPSYVFPDSSPSAAA